MLLSVSVCFKNENRFLVNGVLIIGDENYIGVIMNCYKENMKE